MIGRIGGLAIAIGIASQFQSSFAAICLLVHACPACPLSTPPPTKKEGLEGGEILCFRNLEAAAKN